LQSLALVLVLTTQNKQEKIHQKTQKQPQTKPKPVGPSTSVFPLILETITTAQTMSIGGEA